MNDVVKHKKNSFLQRVRDKKGTGVAKKSSLNRSIEKRVPKLIFSMDATGSREPSWLVAREITAGMFESLPESLDVALAYHGGGRLKEMSDFTSSRKSFLDKLLSVRCEYGGTALNQILDKAVNVRGLKGFVYIGDCFEEDLNEALYLAKQLKMSGVKCFFFHDSCSASQGYDVESGRRAFAAIVDVTGGALLDFNDKSPKTTYEYLRAIAVYSSGGVKALENRTNLLPKAEEIIKRLK